MHFKPVAQALADIVVVVSGLPRSGTSLMMAMLSAGGIPLLTDHQRPPDADNPNGYFELEAIKRLSASAECLATAPGKAVKIVAPLVFQLPLRFQYRIIFIERNLDEVIASQTAMLSRMGRQPALPADQLKAAFARQISRARAILPQAGNQEALFLQHREILKDPCSAAEAVASFLQAELKLEAMAGIVNPALHRQQVE